LNVSSAIGFYYCRKKRGHLPTGIMIHTAKATGYSSVFELLDKRGSEFIKASTKVSLQFPK
jgi:Zinc-finger domain of monoamine-oxidase A repressor R1